MRLFVFFLLLSGFFGSYFYLGFPVVHLIRILPAGMVLMYLHARIRLTTAAQALIGFFTIFFVYTFIISVINISNLDPNAVVNLVVLYVFVLALVLSANYNTPAFFSTLKWAIWVFILASGVVAIWELVTHQHLPYSAAYLFTKDHYYQPTTGFFKNPNDFACILTLAVMYLLSIAPGRQGLKWRLFQLVLILANFAICYTTSSRLSLAVFLVYLVFYYRVWGMRGFMVMLVLVGVIAVAVVNLEFEELEKLSFSSGDSVGNRWELYREGFASVKHSFGFGYGIMGHHYYYATIARTALTDPHNFLLELLIDSGVLVTILYILLNYILFIRLLRVKNKLFLLQLVLYNLVLLSSSSSFFLWPHYIFLIAYSFYSDPQPDLAQQNTA